MRDTPDYIEQKQFEIIYAKPLKERLQMTFDMMDFAREMTLRLVVRECPELDEREVKIEVFRRTYADDFSQEEMERIIEWMRETGPKNERDGSNT